VSTLKKNYKIDKNNIGQRIRFERENLGLSRDVFAELVDLSEYYIGQLERGERQMSLPVLVRIAHCLHVSLDYIVLGKNLQNTDSINESSDTYLSNKDKELNTLLKKCSPNEIEMFKKIIKTILPYLNKN
jgi:transcriptional regulator with XRE-family HTH domain